MNARRDELDAPRALRDFCVDSAQISEPVELILPSAPPSNPRQVMAENFAALPHDAWSGAEPTRTGDKP